MTVREFVERKFQPEHVVMLKKGGKVHYSTHLPIVLDGIPERKIKPRKKAEAEVPVRRLAGIGALRLRDVTTEDCQRLVSEALLRGYSVQYATHIRNCISAIFTHADKKGWITTRNPAKHVALPEMTRKDAHALTFHQIMALVAALSEMPRAIVLCAVLTSMNIAEILGLKWKHVNLTDEWNTIDGESLPPWQIAVRGQWTLRQYGTVKAKGRRRYVVVPGLLAEALAKMKRGGPDDFVFASKGSSGKPVDEKNTLRRHLRPAGAALGMPWLAWHDLRRTFSTLADQVGMSAGERESLMGHDDSRMTARYTKTPSEQSRKAVEAMATIIRGTTVN